jgi:hypothetical protein
MAEQNDRMKRDQAEGERSTAMGNLSKDEVDPAERYDETEGKAGGITNRPLEEEIDNQEALPDRGRSKEEDPDRTSDSERGPDR